MILQIILLCPRVYFIIIIRPHCPYYVRTCGILLLTECVVCRLVCHTREPCKNGSDGPKESRNHFLSNPAVAAKSNKPLYKLDGGPDPLTRRGNFGERVAHCKVQGLSVVSCAETAKPIDLPFGLWTWVGRRKHSSVVFVRWRRIVLIP